MGLLSQPSGLIGLQFAGLLYSSGRLVCSFGLQGHFGLRSSPTMEFYKKAYDLITEQYPFWNRSLGNYHIWVWNRSLRLECNHPGSPEQPYGPPVVSTCSVHCDTTRAMCFCGEGTKYPNRPLIVCNVGSQVEEHWIS